MGIENRVAVITGATGGLGRVVARTLADQGARLALFSTSRDHLSALAAELALPAGRLIYDAYDFKQADSADLAAQAVRSAFGRADLLLHFVGGWIGGKPLTQVPPADVAEMLDQHLWSTLYLARAFVPAMTAQGWGRIVVVSSPTATLPAANRGPYAIAKAAQQALMLTLAQEVKGTGVTANLLVVNTIDVEHARDREPSPQTAAWTTPEEIASSILYLASDDAAVLNGARLPLYGSP